MAPDDAPDPRLCLWEPPASPYGLLGEWQQVAALLALARSLSQLAARLN